MVSWPDLGTRVAVRYRRPAGSVPPLTDAVGHLVAVGPTVRVQTKTGAVVEFAADDVVALRVLTDTPIRTSAIRALEHAAATARAGGQRVWLDGWLLRAADETGPTRNSAVPLDISARISSVPAIVTWYEQRGRDPWLAIPDRLLVLPPGVVGVAAEQVLVRDLTATPPNLGDTAPDDADRATVTDAPDGTRWVGLSVSGLPDDESAVRRCEAALAGAVRRGATRGYAEVAENDTAAAGLAHRLGFRPHHGRRYVDARGGWDTV
ncbi:GNAT family N-acetyltransferase, cg3035/Rv0428c family [Mycobacterium sherrisii]|uniref:GNAT family N-acetyltransferase, cg3035/Rv0428c family n=1 Tax=Mycobacterium sherrisii TaxID=243061 RepID=UPI000A14B56A|nr:GNAT family N-acetyltransferase [Mycobacterium sherrisii]MCV7031251.1 GNAT family N-acetyltransferase [Mycobacterium sherrisii]ORW78270.1 GCN5 family acetyltransferase [Mycobacterium sherrisii]